MPARFKLDENLPRDAEALLRKAGHDVHTVLDERLGGSPDPRVLDACRIENRILITFDLDFSDIRFYPERGVKERSRQLPRNCGSASGERLGNTAGAGMKSRWVR
jgi:hypothetical protein